MLQINGKNYYKPREISELGLIVNTKGKKDYKFILRLIKSGKLPARQFNDSELLPYYIVEESEIQKYNDLLTGE